MKVAFVVFAVLAVVVLKVNAVPAVPAVPAVVCSEDQVEGKIEYHPHPCNCNTYYVCLGTEPIPMPCPRGLHWNQKKEICDFPGPAHCRKASNC
ncbi:peritrophin-1-like [Halictus rubicundus]|uniref:peritrophin-1-like n=1 Tax=Halictus rubicundus TaxID=77578 RepID=UPI00403727BF